MKSYIKFEHIDWSRYCVGRLEELYKQMGILFLLENMVSQIGVDPHSVIAADHIYASDKTIQHMKECLLECWEFYNINHKTGMFNDPNRVYKRRKTKKLLTLNEWQMIENNFKSWGPIRNNGIPDDCI